MSRIDPDKPATRSWRDVELAAFDLTTFGADRPWVDTRLARCVTDLEVPARGEASDLRYRAGRRFEPCVDVDVVRVARALRSVERDLVPRIDDSARTRTVVVAACGAGSRTLQAEPAMTVAASTLGTRGDRISPTWRQEACNPLSLRSGWRRTTRSHRRSLGACRPHAREPGRARHYQRRHR